MSPELLATIRAAQQGLQLLRAAKRGDQSGRRSNSDDRQRRVASGTQHASLSQIGTIRSSSDSAASQSRRIATGERFPRSQTHKASSAESIIAYCLKQRGLTGEWKAGSLTDRQKLRLLEDVRLYGRRWLRHEAEGVFGEIANRSVSGSDDLGSRNVDHHDMASGFGRVETSTQSGTAEELGRAFGRVEIKTDGTMGTTSPIRRFFARARQFVRELIHSAVMAIRGTTNLDATETEQADRAADVQDSYFHRFEQQVLANPPIIIQPPGEPSTVIQVGPPPITPRRFIARAESYADSAWQSAQRINHAAHTGSNGQPPRKMRGGNPARWERLVMGHPKTEHCHECPPDAALGWVPIGTLRPIGDRECGHLCLCHFEYSDSLERPEMKPKKPKPEKPKTHKIKEPTQLDALMADLREKLGKAGVKGLKVNVTVEVGKK